MAEAKKTTKPKVVKAAGKPASKPKAKAAPEPKQTPLPEQLPEKKGLSGVRIDPANVRLIPGNSVTFIADDKKGRVTASITSDRGVRFVTASRNQGEARVGTILEVAGTVEVEFFENGEPYARGSWPVG